MYSLLEFAERVPAHAARCGRVIALGQLDHRVTVFVDDLLVVLVVITVAAHTMCPVALGASRTRGPESLLICEHSESAPGLPPNRVRRASLSTDARLRMMPRVQPGVRCVLRGFWN